MRRSPKRGTTEYYELRERRINLVAGVVFFSTALLMMAAVALSVLMGGN